MLTHQTQIRVRYGETDKMGCVYYGNYPLYYEVARTELMRHLGFTYKQIEDEGIMLPVVSLKVKYIKQAFYDDLLTIKTKITRKPMVKIHFEYEVFRENNELVNTGETTLVFVDAQTMQPHRAPQSILNVIEPFF